MVIKRKKIKKVTKHLHLEWLVKIFVIVAGLLFITSFFAYYNKVRSAVGSSVNVSVVVHGCDNDVVCDQYEDTVSCPNDCGCNLNSSCEALRGETTANCPADCPEVVVPPVVPPAQPTGGGGGGSAPTSDTSPPVISNIGVNRISFNYAYINASTNEASVCSLYVGKDFNYSDIKKDDGSYLFSHSFEAKDLLSDTIYYYKISCRDSAGNITQSAGKQFSTSLPVDNIAPGNVISLKVIWNQNIVQLDWNNPSNSDLAGIKIFRSDKFFIADPFSAMAVYTGKGTFYVDRGLTAGKTYYYSVFSYDKVGNHSSGVVHTIKILALPTKVGTTPVATLSTTTTKVIPPVTVPLKPIQLMKTEDILVKQNNQTTPLSATKIDQNQNTTIIVPGNKVPAETRQIVVDVISGGEVSSVLASKNREGNFVVDLPKMTTVSDVYGISVRIYDKNNQLISTTAGYIITTLDKSKTKPAIVAKKETIRQKICNFVVRVEEKVKNVVVAMAKCVMNIFARIFDWFWGKK